MRSRLPFVRAFVVSPYLDVFAAVLILAVSIVRRFHETMYENGEIIFNVPLSQIGERMSEGAFPLGFVSIVAAIFAVLSTRFIGKQSNIGNIIGVFTTITSGTIDYLFGNGSAIITYPLTFVIMNFAVFKWAKGEVIRKIDLRYYVIILAGLIIGFGLVYLGASLFGGNTDPLFLNVVSITFGLSIGGNISSALKYEQTWLSWVIYNLVQLVKSVLQANLANVAKYTFYLINSSFTLADWKFNGDSTKIKEAQIA